MGAPTRSFYILATLFAFSQIITQLWPTYHRRSSNSIAANVIKRIIPSSSDPLESQCEDVLLHSDRCAYVKEYCSDYAAGRINYLHFYFCDLESLPALALIIVTGVTFLAFGNASPDIFGTFSAIGAGSGTLAVGEVVGAAAFTTSVVVGSMMIVQPFTVGRIPFLRDTIFFTGCILFTVYSVLSKRIALWQSIALIVAYVVYVVIVVTGNWRSQHVQVDVQESLSNDGHQQGQEQKQNANRSNSNADCTENTCDIEATSAHPAIIITSQDESPRISISSESGFRMDTMPCPESIPTTSSHDHSHKPRPPRLQFPVITISDYTNLSTSLKTDVQKKQIVEYAPLSNGHRSSGEGSPFLSPIHDDSLDPSYSRFQHALQQNSLILPDRSDPSNRPRSPICQHPHCRFPFQEEITVSYRQRLINVFNDWVKPSFFPTLMGWDEKSWFLKFLAVGSIPIVFFLTLTLTVVDLAEEEKINETGIPFMQNVPGGYGPLVEGESSGQRDAVDKYNGWCQLSTMIQMIFAPVFIAAVITSAAGRDHIVILIAFGIGILLSGLIYLTSTEEEPPKFYEALAFVGFLVAMTWIFLVANEVVGILQAFGMILGIDDAILGLTVFAMGNSLGDLVSNITIAKMGYPRMAFSACFGGPLLNMLLGVGVSGAYVSLTTGTPVPLDISPTLLVSLGGVLVTMIVWIIVVPLSGYVLSRWLGFFLVGVYIACMVANVVIEVVMMK
ncbi:hypothetical protein BGZ46_002697 [Entomortierella lignicola]|nr:hypothetical protein BGZ46_002697 [Entomortierella lignicola]